MFLREKLFLQLIAYSEDKKQKFQIIKCINHNQYFELKKIAINILQGVLPLKKDQLKYLKNSKTLIRKLAEGKVTNNYLATHYMTISYICHGNACNLFAPVVLLGPSGPWLCQPMMRFNTQDWHRRLYANNGCWDRDADRITKCLAGATWAVVTSGDVTCQVPPLKTISGPYFGQSIAITSRSHLPSHVVLPPDPLRGPY